MAYPTNAIISEARLHELYRAIECLTRMIDLIGVSGDQVEQLARNRQQLQDEVKMHFLLL